MLLPLILDVLSEYSRPSNLARLDIHGIYSFELVVKVSFHSLLTSSTSPQSDG